MSIEMECVAGVKFKTLHDMETCAENINIGEDTFFDVGASTLREAGRNLTNLAKLNIQTIWLDCKAFEALFSPRKQSCLSLLLKTNCNLITVFIL